MWGRWPAGQRGALSCQRLGAAPAHTRRRPTARNTETCRGRHSFAPPSALPGISPTWGEIGSVAAGTKPKNRAYLPCLHPKLN
ncbi:hypothetical protein FJ959_03635 [Mesorhizobium sp. B2-2-4]|nr:hypothetical protein FJ959_03635 [Mesorhizobium sp. B2-2-4]TPM69475.1 hypothetical protein FJ965_05035 [Mesorhizobium sp. B2-2-1]TPN72753.1 hypothetical protein FJ984_00775 [Mesorhizobium sp. B1-1-3]